MEAFISYTLTGLFIGAAYAIAASGLVLTYTTTRVFNLAHGATSMVMAFVYWQLHVSSGLPTWLSLLLVLFVIAPVYGVVLERVVMRGLGDAPVSVSLVVTVGLFVFLVGVAQQFWPPAGRNIAQFFGYDTLPVLGVRVSYHYLITIALSAVVAGALYVLLNRTRIGTAMRAAVDNRELLQLFGASANRVSMLSWAIGSSLAALAGVLLVSTVGLDYYNLTFLVINSFAAAMLGRLSSLPLTYVGAIVLGLLIEYSRGLRARRPADRERPADLAADVDAVRHPDLRPAGAAAGRPGEGHPRRERAVRAPGARRPPPGCVVAALLVLPFLDATNTQRFGIAIAYGIVMLSLVLLTGYGGYVSLAQFTFVGVGAAVVAKMNTTSPLAILFAVLIAAGRRGDRRAAGAAADRAVPRAGHARVRPADGQAGVPGRLPVRLRRHAAGQAGVAARLRLRQHRGLRVAHGRRCSPPSASACWRCAAGRSAGCSSRCATARPPAARSG